MVNETTYREDSPLQRRQPGSMGVPPLRAVEFRKKQTASRRSGRDDNGCIVTTHKDTNSSDDRLQEFRAKRIPRATSRASTVTASASTFLACCCLASVLGAQTLSAQTLSGKVRNGSTAQPAAGDDVILLRFGNGMEEESRTKADAQGAFTLKENSAQGQYMVRVMHQGVNYDHTVIGTNPLAIVVFDAVHLINGLGGSIGIAQMESDGSNLKVTEMYAIANASDPPVTQVGPHNFDIFLPQKASFDKVEVRYANGVWTKMPPAPVPGQSGHYVLNFPIRPGDTLFKYTYRLPYGGPTRFHLRLPYPIAKFAVMHPPSMSFKASRAGAFAHPGVANGLKIEKVVSEPVVGSVPVFEISGVGAAPPLPSAAVQAAAPVQKAPGTSSPPAAASVPAASGVKGQVAAPAGPSKREFWLTLAIIAGALVLGVGIFAVWKMRNRSGASGKPAGGRLPLVDVLKEELFQLEVDRAQGSISPDDYAATKQALNQTLQRAMTKAAADS